MTPERWRQIEDLYQAALERTPGERIALLSGAEPELRRKVESLLAGDGSVLDKPAWERLDDQTLTLTVEQRSDKPALRSWGPFQLRERVGRGGFGEVYRAFDPALQREIAVKLLLKRDGTGEQESAILREARAMARVSHPNLVPIYGVHTYDGRAGFWSAFVRGRTLSALLEIHGPFGEQETIHIGLDLCRALSAVHAAGLLHRDIKTGNAMREEGGRILLMDFGLTEASAKQTFRGGTPGYMAPEIRAGERASVRSDIFATGVLLYHLLTAKYPEGQQWSLLEQRPDLSTAVVGVIHRAIHTDPEQRFASAAEMAAALAEAGGSSAVTVAPPAPAGVKRRWVAGAMVAATAGAVMALAGGGYAWNLHSRGAPDAAALRVQARYDKAHDLVEHYYRPKALETAIPELEAITREEPTFAAGFADLGRANFLQFWDLRDAKYVEPAREASLMAISLDGNTAAPHVTLGMLYTQTGKNDLATQELDTALRIDRLNAEVWGARAELYMQEGRTDEVDPALRKAMDLAPDDWRWPKQLGDYYRRTSHFDSAAAADRESVRLAPDSAGEYNNLGVDLRYTGKLNEAADAFRKAIATEPIFSAYVNLGNVLEDKGDLAGAAEVLRKATALDPSNYFGWEKLALNYKLQNTDPARTAATCRKALDLAEALRVTKPRDSVLLAGIGLMYAAIGDAEHALPSMRQAKALEPDNGELYFLSGEVFELLGRRPDAIAEIGLALRHGYNLALAERDPALADLRKDKNYLATARSFR